MRAAYDRLCRVDRGAVWLALYIFAIMADHAVQVCVIRPFTGV